MDRLTWLGHATVLVETGGAVLLTDPVLRRRVAHLRRHVRVPVLPEHVDAVLLSHLHHDHLDVPSLGVLGAEVPLVVPQGAASSRTVRSLRREVRELAPGDSITVAGVRVEAVPAVHDGRRHPFAAEGPAVGFVVHGARRVYFAGDTELFDGMRTIAGGGLDVALLPVWGWGPRLGPGHMDPDQAARAAQFLQPALAVPIHWGTYLPLGARRRLGHLLEDPGHAFAQHVAQRAPEVRVSVLAPGERLEL